MLGVGLRRRGVAVLCGAPGVAGLVEPGLKVGGALAQGREVGGRRLQTLHDVGLDYVKLDSSLCAGVSGSDAAREFVRSTVALLHALSVTVLAEGVVEDSDLARLQGISLPAKARAARRSRC